MIQREWFKYLLKEKGLTQKKVAELAGVSIRTVHRFAYNTNAISAEYRKKIEDVIENYKEEWWNE